MAYNPFGQPQQQQQQQQQQPGQPPARNGYQPSLTGAPGTGGTPSSSFNPFGGSPSNTNPFGTPTSGFTNPFLNNGSNTNGMFSGGPGSSLINLGSVPNAPTAQMTISPEVQAMLEGNGGFSPSAMASMRATATESAANAGQTQMSQVKRQMAQNGVTGPGAAGYAGAVAKQTGEQTQANLSAVEQQNANAELAQQNLAAQLSQQAGGANMQSANAQALANAQMLYNAMLANQQARLGTQMNLNGSASLT